MIEVYVGISIYLLAMLVVGYRASRRISNSEDFIVAGRKLPLWLTVGTLSATWFGGATVMGAAGAAFSKGFLGVIADPFGAALCLFVAGLFFARMLRRMRLTTLVDFFDSRFDRRAGFVAAVSMVFLYVGWTGSLLVSIGFILHTITGMSTVLAIILGTVIALAYTMAGGMLAVAWTDVVQIVLVILGLVIAFPIILSEAGGIDSVLERLPEGSFSMIPDSASTSDWMFYIRAWLVIGLGNVAGQDLMQRCLSARNESVAQNAAYISGGVYLTFGVIPVLIGMIGSLLMPDISNPEFIVPTLVMEYLPPVIVAIFISALLAAVMSSADSAMLAASSVIGKNLLAYVRPEATDQQILKWTRYSVPFVALFSLVVALYFQNIYDLLVNAYSIALVSMIAPLALGIWWRRANAIGALSGMITGFVCWVGLPLVSSSWPSDLVGLVAGAIVLIAVSLITGKTDPAKPLRDADGNELPFSDRLGVLSLFSS
ncbi:MAG: sodium:solute symporter family protein [Bacteroidetes bacterium]|nr:sodium:solute symporter family protein [Bacteroidota bacterium]